MQIAIHVSVLQLFTDRLFVRPVAFGERLTNERYVRSVRSVALLKQSSTNERNSERGKIASAGRAIIRVAGALAR